AVFFGAIFKNDFVWGVADMLNGLMAIPNLIGLIGLSGVVVFESKRIIDKMKQEKKEKNISVSS
ncbi:alanine:cation symporter family protein, partial [Bacillus pumilus]|uniref:alanine:cation symporter family protein n=2 Tax=Bacillaceae TaxID=186817 RepID=UPI000554F2AD